MMKKEDLTQEIYSVINKSYFGTEFSKLQLIWIKEKEKKIIESNLLIK